MAQLAKAVWLGSSGAMHLLVTEHVVSEWSGDTVISHSLESSMECFDSTWVSVKISEHQATSCKDWDPWTSGVSRIAYLAPGSAQLILVS